MTVYRDPTFAKAYDGALDAEQRLFVMRGQLEKLQSDGSLLERYVTSLKRVSTLFEDNLPTSGKIGFELSPRSWENVQAAQEVAPPAIEIPKDAFPLKGVISEASQDQIAKLMRYAESHAEVVLDCSVVNRVDYAYVGNLIGQLMQLLGNGKAVTLQGQNALVNELFRAMGIHQLANLVPAKLV